MIPYIYLYIYMYIYIYIGIITVDLVNLTREDLWSSGVHFKKARRTFILVYINYHTGGNIKSTVARTIDKSKF
jgi:hypothetical protein